MREVSYLDREPYIKMYEQAAHELCYGTVGAQGSLLPLLGPLRAGSSREEGLRYWLEHERDLDDASFRTSSFSVSDWNLDFSLPTVVRVAGDESRRVMSIETFVGELVESLDVEDVSEFSVKALSLAVQACYEEHWLQSQEKKLRGMAKKYAGMHPRQIDDNSLGALSLDVVLRKATIDNLKERMWDNVADAHNIAKFFPGTARELLRDRALLALTRPDNEVAFGQYALTQDEAADMLRTTSRRGAGD